MKDVSLKRIFEYSDYRDYLRDYYEYSKSTKKSFSFRLFSRLCGFKSSNFLLLVMNGRSRLTAVSVEMVIKGVKFNKEEAHFFRHLVSFVEAKTAEQRAVHAKEILQTKSYKKIFPLSEAQYRYLGTWYLPVIRSIIGLEGFNQDPEWIAQNISPQLEVGEVKKALDELKTLGLIRQDENKRWIQTNAMLSTPSEVASSFAGQYHRQMLERASESIDRFNRDQRHLAGLTIALDADSVVKIKEMAEKFRNDVMEVASHCISAESIYQVNLQAFPLFQTPKSKLEKK